ncbi:hypothetical protein C5Y96_09705 [Blastopirellula marina]|uniref:Uncharacterized protein n=1 Tax=Blastopirellula marina TaxID=124 RepID=A0A2S8FSZ0_9BACT|nr:hypothetical protein C5Y96_09705 [Blastopirellula marina]RCS53167.1 hypothetical protein DTL36_09715 [Bremerella cremea]
MNKNAKWLSDRFPATWRIQKGQRDAKHYDASAQEASRIRSAFDEASRQETLDGLAIGLEIGLAKRPPVGRFFADI